MSASTGTADDRGGNDKADALVDSKRKKWSVQRNFFLDPSEPSGPTIYDISSAGMQPGEPENRQVWLNGDRMINHARLPW
jgi:hypothetical protein